MTYRGTVYGLPLNYKVITLIYNKKLVPTPPKTSKELVAMAKKLTDGEVGPLRPRLLLLRLLLPRRPPERLRRPRLRPRPEAGPERPREREGARAPDALVRRWTGSSPPSRRRRSSPRSSTSGKAAMVFSGPWFLGEIAKDIDYGLAPAPDDRRGGRQADAPLDDRRGRLRRRPVEEQGGGLRLRQVPHRHAAGEGHGPRGAPDPGEQGGLRRPDGRRRRRSSRPSASRSRWPSRCRTSRR